MTTNEKLYSQPLKDRLIIMNNCNLKLKPINNMRVDEKLITHLTTKNGASVRVATDKDGKLHLVDNDNQITRDILPDGNYQSDGLTFNVKDGRQVKSKLSMKAGVKPKAVKIRFVSIGQKMQQGQKARKEEISTKRFNGLM